MNGESVQRVLINYPGPQLVRQIAKDTFEGVKVKSGGRLGYNFLAMVGVCESHVMVPSNQVPLPWGRSRSQLRILLLGLSALVRPVAHNFLSTVSAN